MIDAVGGRSCELPDPGLRHVFVVMRNFDSESLRGIKENKLLLNVLLIDRPLYSNRNLWPLRRLPSTAPLLLHLLDHTSAFQRRPLEGSSGKSCAIDEFEGPESLRCVEAEEREGQRRRKGEDRRRRLTARRTTKKGYSRRSSRRLKYFLTKPTT